jgi:hypothetical protein
MPTDYKSKISEAFIGPATLWRGTAVPFSSGNLSGAEPTSGSLVGLTEFGDPVQVTLRTTLDYYQWEGDRTASEVYVSAEEMEITATNATLYGANGKAFWEMLSGNRINGSGEFGKTSGGAFASTSFTVIGQNRRLPSQLIVVSMYRLVCEEISIPFQINGLTKVSFTLKGLIHSTASNGVGKIFYV